MSALYVTCFFCFGLLFGSFFNVVGLRTPLGQSFTTGRSYCPECLQKLSWYELIPLYSYFIQRGKCRHCQQKISGLYPLVELLTGSLFAFSFYLNGFQYELLGALLLSSLLMIVFVADITYMVIPNQILFFFMLLFIIFRIIQPHSPWWSSILGFILGYAMIAVVIIISRGGMGAGDMKLCAVLGIILGYNHILLTFFLACVLGSIVGGVLLILKIIDRKQKIPFGPYIGVASVITYYFGQPISTWYVGLF